jgi:hypothetical protein
MKATDKIISLLSRLIMSKKLIESSLNPLKTYLLANEFILKVKSNNTASKSLALNLLDILEERILEQIDKHDVDKLRPMLL